LINFPFSSLFKSFGAILLAVGTSALYFFVKKSGREEIEKEYLESQIEEFRKREEVNETLHDEYKKIDIAHSASPSQSDFLSKLRNKGL
jgi:hypothetical protein